VNPEEHLNTYGLNPPSWVLRKILEDGHEWKSRSRHSLLRNTSQLPDTTPESANYWRCCRCGLILRLYKMGEVTWNWNAGDCKQQIMEEALE
jgi:hypothetical protein